MANTKWQSTEESHSNQWTEKEVRAEALGLVGPDEDSAPERLPGKGLGCP